MYTPLDYLPASQSFPHHRHPSSLSCIPLSPQACRLTPRAAHILSSLFSFRCSIQLLGNWLQRATTLRRGRLSFQEGSLASSLFFFKWHPSAFLGAYCANSAGRELSWKEMLSGVLCCNAIPLIESIQLKATPNRHFYFSGKTTSLLLLIKVLRRQFVLILLAWSFKFSLWYKLTKKRYEYSYWGWIKTKIS